MSTGGSVGREKSVLVWASWAPQEFQSWRHALHSKTLYLGAPAASEGDAGGKR